MVDGWHDLRWASSQEFAQAMFCILLPFLFVFQHSHAPVCFVDPVNQSQARKTHQKNENIEYSLENLFYEPDIRVHENVPCKLKDAQTCYAGHRS